MTFAGEAPVRKRRSPADLADPTDGGFASICAGLGFDDPGWCASRHAAVLSALEAASRLEPAQVRAMLRVQRCNLNPGAPGRAVSLGGDFRDALRCVREEARRQGRLVTLGQAWAGSNQLVELLTRRQPVVVRYVLASAVAGEVLCRVLDDVVDWRVFGPREEELLRRAWRLSLPLPAYFQ